MEGLSWSSPCNQVGTTPLRAGDPAAPAPAVYRVAHDRVTHMLQVNSNLVGSTGVKLQAEQVNALEPGHHGRLGAGSSAGG
jgi:hypothetical protein